MAKSSSSSSTQSDLGKLLLRLGLGGIVLFHGVFKLTHGVDWIKEPLTALGLPGLLAYGTYVAELFAPILVLIGLWTRAAALVIALDMLMAFVLVLRASLFKVNPMGGGWAVEVEALILINALVVACLGAGRYAVPRATSAWD